MEFIKNGKYVEASYVLTVGEEDEVMESVPKERPLAFIFGNGQMLESFEKNMKGLKPGDSFDFRIPCEEAFGKVVDMVLDLRAKAKAAKDWATSDRIRDELAAAGFEVNDTKDGSVWRLDK